jgi:hypothetical protein
MIVLQLNWSLVMFYESIVIASQICPQVQIDEPDDFSLVFYFVRVEGADEFVKALAPYADRLVVTRLGMQVIVNFGG